MLIWCIGLILMGCEQLQFYQFSFFMLFQVNCVEGLLE